MPMRLLIMLQLFFIFLIYTALTFGLPALIFHKKAARFPLTARCFIYFTIGNFYLMNLVYLLQILKISNRFTLIFFTVVPGIAAAFRVNRVSVRQRFAAAETGFMKLTLGLLGFRTFLRRSFGALKNRIVRSILWFLKLFSRHPIEAVLVILLTAAVVVMYGTNSINAYGYTFSDLPVHNYWINAMEENNIFVAGVYPFGFHCIVYYIHKVFSIDTYVLLRLMGVTQTLYIHLMLLLFLKAFCKSRYVPYLACGAYVLLFFFNLYCTERFHSTLPQEFGMLFILPSIYFALEFFKVKKEELQREKEELAKQPKRRYRKKEKNKWYRIGSPSGWYLFGFALSFSMTLAAHFYDTMIAGLFCVAIAFGYAARFFRPRYMGPVLKAFFLSLFIAAAPMVTAFAIGTPLQGSLTWGLEVMTNGDEDDSGTAQENGDNKEEPDTPVDDDKDTTIPESGKTGEDGTLAEGDVRPEESKTPLLERLAGWAVKLYEVMSGRVDEYLVSEGLAGMFLGILAGMAGLLILATISILVRRYDYGMMLISICIFTGLMQILLSSELLGIPQLMDANRSRIYVAYMLPLLGAFLADGILYTLCGWIKKQWLFQGISLACCVGAAAAAYRFVPLRVPDTMVALETNGAITCVTNILKKDPQETFTIVSANDELRMVEEKGYHFQISTFLNGMEGAGKYAAMTIPTKYVYFFVEKIPLDYTVPYEKSGQKVSEEGAEQKLPMLPGLLPYEGENRWITMSRMYYWAQAFQSRYPNEFKVFYEDEQFVCYYVKQNEYSLYNFALDYGYNTK